MIRIVVLGLLLVIGARCVSAGVSVTNTDHIGWNVGMNIYDDDSETVQHYNRDRKRPRILEVVEGTDISSDEEGQAQGEDNDTNTKQQNNPTLSAWHQVKQAAARWVSDKVDQALAENDDDDGWLSE